MQRGTPRTLAARILESDEASLLDLLDNALNKGVVLNGDLTLALAGVDLIYLRMSLLLCAADRILPAAASDRAATHRQPRRPRRP